MGWGSKIDPATGRKMRESAKLGRTGSAGAIRRVSDGTARPAERRVDHKRRQRTEAGSIRAENQRSAKREKGWRRAASQNKQRKNSWLN